jgi:3-oxoacyl-[acyl-carrier-protein] synthase II
MSGAGLVTCLGLDRQTIWQAVRDGRSGLAKLTQIEQAEQATCPGGEAPPLPVDESAGDVREARYLRHAMRAALRDAGIPGDLPYSPQRCGVMLGTTLHGIRAGGRFLRSDDANELNTFLPTATLALARGDVAATGLAATTCSACSSGLGSIALAITLLRAGELDLVIAGGYDPISEYAYAGFNGLRLVAPSRPRPFCRDREGMKIGEGYGMVVLERAADAAARGHAALAQVMGYGESADAHHLTQPDPTGQGAARAVMQALQDAGLDAADIDLVCAHATGTPDNDRGEHASLRTVLGDRLASVPVVAFKANLAHTLGGAGSVELILAAMALREGCVPPTPGITREELEYPDIALQIGQAKAAPLRHTLNVSLGFGGANTAMILGHPQPIVEAPQVMRRVGGEMVAITAVECVLPQTLGSAALLKRYAKLPTAVAGDDDLVDEALFASLLNARRVRRMSDYVKVSLAASELARQAAGLEPESAALTSSAALVATCHASTSYSYAYYRQVVDEGLAAANPMLFAEGVPNAGAAHLSMMLGLRGPCQTLLGSRCGVLDALHIARLRIASGMWERAIICAGEEFDDMIRRGYGHCGHYAGRSPSLPFEEPARGFAGSWGAAAVVVERLDLAEARGAKVLAIVEGTATRVAAGARPRYHVDAVTQAAQTAALPDQIFCSANGTSLDRIELLGLSRIDGDATTTLATPGGYIAEMFSVAPAVSLALAVHGKVLPAVFTSGSVAADGVALASGEAMTQHIGVLATDYTGLVAAARLRRLS